jgi:mannose-1-phosphate guanylyltransferase
MKAMVLAAGLGTRLRPITNTRPKALVEVGGRTLLEITLSRLKAYGVGEVIINVHHFADMVVDYLKTHHNFGLHIEISREEVLLDTGGGLKKAGWFFESTPDEPFVLHNVDIITTIDLQRMLEFHLEHRPLATLAMQNRKTSRYLLFDDKGRLCGKSPTPDPRFASLGFAGIHVISPRLLSMMPADEIFSIVNVYVDLASQGKNILAFPSDEYSWKDMGRPENLKMENSKLDESLNLKSEIPKS